VLALGSIPRDSRRPLQPQSIIAGNFAVECSHIAGGLATSFMALLLARSFVGFGEAAYAPAQSMIPDRFRKRAALPRRRSSRRECCSAGVRQVIGGMIAPRYGCRCAFVVAAAESSGDRAFRSGDRLVGTLGCCTSLRFFRARFLSMIAGEFDHVCQRFANSLGVDSHQLQGFSLREASVALSIITLVSLILGVLCGGYVADKLQKKFPYED